MKKLLILSMALSFFLACNNDKGNGRDRDPNYRDKDDYSKDDNRNKDEYSNEGWAERDRSTFLKDCMSASGDNQAQAKKICSCVLAKLEKKYTSLSEGDRKGGEAEGRRLATQCLDEIGGNNSNDDNVNNDKSDYSGSDWSKSDENRFVSECAGEAAKNVGETRANQYCECMLEKAKKMYSSYSEADRKLGAMTQEELTRLAKDCNQ